jgi:hypothetical protein
VDLNSARWQSRWAVDRFLFTTRPESSPGRLLVHNWVGARIKTNYQFRQFDTKNWIFLSAGATRRSTKPDSGLMDPDRAGSGLEIVENAGDYNA